MSLELLRLTSNVADQLWNDIHFAWNMLVRVLFMLFEAGKWRANFAAGKHWPGPQRQQ